MAGTLLVNPVDNFKFVAQDHLLLNGEEDFAFTIFGEDQIEITKSDNNEGEVEKKRPGGFEMGEEVGGEDDDTGKNTESDKVSLGAGEKIDDDGGENPEEEEN